MKLTHILGAGLLTCALAAQAQEGGLPLWEAGAFAGFASTPAYPGSVDRTSRALVLPFFIYRGDVLRADRGSIGARVLRSTNYEFDVGFAASLPASSNDIAARKGMPDLGTLIEFGPRLNMTLARPSPSSRVRLELPVRAVIELNSGIRGQGVALEPELVYETRDVGAGWGLSASGGFVFANSKLNNYFYGVAPQFATVDRPAFNAKAGLIATRLNLSTSKDLTPDVRVFAFVRFDSYGGAANRDSPLFLKSSGTSAGLGLAWTLGRSERRAQD